MVPTFFAPTQVLEAIMLGMLIESLMVSYSAIGCHGVGLRIFYEKNKERKLIITIKAIPRNTKIKYGSSFFARKKKYFVR